MHIGLQAHKLKSHILSHLYSYNATQDTHSIQKMKLYENKTTTCFHTSEGKKKHSKLLFILLHLLARTLDMIFVTEKSYAPCTKLRFYMVLIA